MSVHIGEKVKARAKELRIGPTELAGLVNTSKQNVYGIYRRKTLDTELLKKLSLVLKCDFFDYYYDKQWVKTFNEVQASYHKNNAKSTVADNNEVVALKKELQELKENMNCLQSYMLLRKKRCQARRKNKSSKAYLVLYRKY